MSPKKPQVRSKRNAFEKEKHSKKSHDSVKKSRKVEGSILEPIYLLEGVPTSITNQHRAFANFPATSFSPQSSTYTQHESLSNTSPGYSSQRQPLRGIWNKLPQREPPVTKQSGLPVGQSGQRYPPSNVPVYLVGDPNNPNEYSRVFLGGVQQIYPVHFNKVNRIQEQYNRRHRHQKSTEYEFDSSYRHKNKSSPSHVGTQVTERRSIYTQSTPSPSLETIDESTMSRVRRDGSQKKPMLTDEVVEDLYRKIEQIRSVVCPSSVDVVEEVSRTHRHPVHQATTYETQDFQHSAVNIDGDHITPCYCPQVPHNYPPQVAIYPPNCCTCDQSPGDNYNGMYYTQTRNYVEPKVMDIISDPSIEEVKSNSSHSKGKLWLCKGCEQNAGAWKCKSCEIYANMSNNGKTKPMMVPLEVSGLLYGQCLCGNNTTKEVRHQETNTHPEIIPRQGRSCDCSQWKLCGCPQNHSVIPTKHIDRSEDRLMVCSSCDLKKGESSCQHCTPAKDQNVSVEPEHEYQSTSEKKPKRRDVATETDFSSHETIEQDDTDDMVLSKVSGAEYFCDDEPYRGSVFHKRRCSALFTKNGHRVRKHKKRSAVDTNPVMYKKYARKKFRTSIIPERKLFYKGNSKNQDFSRTIRSHINRCDEESISLRELQRVIDNRRMQIRKQKQTSKQIYNVATEGTNLFQKLGQIKKGENEPNNALTKKVMKQKPKYKFKKVQIREGRKSLYTLVKARHRNKFSENSLSSINKVSLRKEKGKVALIQNEMADADTDTKRKATPDDKETLQLHHKFQTTIRVFRPNNSRKRRV